MNNRYNDILIESLEDCKCWDDLKPKLETYNTSETKQTKKKTIAGKIFEFFAKYYFLTEPEQTDLYDKVWLYDEVPIEVTRKLKLPSIDHGIDLLLQDKDGKFHAVQCKFKNDETKKLSWSGDKIANVFALGTLCDSVIVYTNASDVTNVAKNFDSKYSQIAYDGLLGIQPDIFENIYKLAKKQKPKELIKFKPREHQEKAIQSVTNHLGDNERGQLILPCGAGKTLTSLWIKERMDCQNTLVLLPSLALLKQIKNDWARHKEQSYKYICVCSEKDIDKDSTDSITVHTYEIGGPVTTDPEIVKVFLERPENKVVFSTYQSLRVIQDACHKINDYKFCLTICDEAHRTAGSKNKNVYTLIHDNEKIPSGKRLYMTATPKVVATSLKSKLGDDYELLCDMSNPNVFGEEAFRMTFGEAIEQKILVDYKIIGIGVTDKQVKDFIESRNYIGEITIDELAHNFSLDLVMNKYKAFHALTFHSRVHLAREFSNRHKSFFEETFAEHVEGKQTTTYRAKVLHNFKSSEKAIVSNARCLTEGVDVPSIDLIYFCDPKTSKIDIVQASGRALRTDSSGKKSLGYIVVPLFHHIGEDVEQEIKKKPIFNYLIQVVRSLCDQDERLQAEIDSIAFKKGKRNSSKIEIEFSNSETEKIIKFEGLEKQLREVLFDEIIEKNKDNWEVMFMKLREFITEHGHMNVSRNYDPRLQNWIYERRRRNREGTLDKIQKKRLDEIGFDWKSEEFRKQTDLDDIWWDTYEKLIEYYKKNGHSNVPARYKDKTLGTWVVAQRVAKRKGNISKGREELLEELDFVWEPKVRVFEEFCEKLQLFKDKYGHTEVPIINKEYPKLGRWTNTYRVILNNGIENEDGSITYNDRSLSKVQIDKLDELGFKKSVRTRDWLSGYKKLKEFYLQYGHSKPVQSENENLYSWCYRVRKQKDKLDKKQIKLLEEIEFDFNFISKFSSKGSRHRWEERVIELQLFHEEHNHFEVTSENEEFEGLYKWLVYQRRKYKNGKLSEDSINALKKINFDFDRDFNPKFSNKSNGDLDWEDRFQELKDYYEENGTFHISINDTEHSGLLWWLRYQRKLFRDGKLNQEYAEKMLDLGYSFTKTYRGETRKPNVRYEELWDNKFEMLKEFYQAHKTFVIPNTNQTLHLWVRSQRKQYREKTLEESRIEKLNSINFDWFSKPIVTPQDDSEKWNTMFDKLKSFKKLNGHCVVPQIYEEDKALGRWVNDQRNKYNKGTLSKERIDILNSVEFVWDKKEFDWNQKFELLKEFYSKYNHFEVRQSDAGYGGLYYWLHKMKKDGVDSDKKEKLKSIGLEFIEYNQENWFEMFAHLAKYKETTGNFEFEDKLSPVAKWFNDQKILISRGELPKDKLSILEAIGINHEDISKPRKKRTKNSATWHEMLAMLKEYHRIHGNYNVPKKYSINPTLSKWIYYQKTLKRTNKLEPEKIKALEEIGFEFPKPLENQKSWDERFEELLDYKKANGDCQVPVRFKENQQLATWVRTQRRYYKEGTIEAEKKDKLEKIGFIWRVNN